MENLTVYELLNMLEGQIERIENYEDYRIANDHIDELRRLFDENGFRYKK